MGLPDIFKSFRIKREIDRTEELKLVIEGGYQDDWRTHHLVRWQYHIPGDCKEIVIQNYILQLVGIFNESGVILVDQNNQSDSNSIIVPDDPLWSSGGPSIPLRPTTIIVEDGRIFHDRDLLESEANSGRLRHLLESLAKKYENQGTAGRNKLQLTD